MLHLFLAATREYGLPSRVCSDKGSENFGVSEHMIRICRTGRHSHIAGNINKESSVYGKMYTDVLLQLFTLCSTTWKNGDPDPLSDVDLFVLHAVF